jgi:hypothetical protein
VRGRIAAASVAVAEVRAPGSIGLAMAPSTQSGIGLLVALPLIAAACGAAESLSPGSSVGSGQLPSATVSASASATPTPTRTVAPTPTVVAVPATGAWARLTVAGPAPKAREAHTWTVDPDGRTAYLFGGRDGSIVFGDLWRFDLATGRWEELQPGGDKPEARFGQNAVWLAGKGLVVFAGQASSGFFNDLWLYDPISAGWSELPSGGAPPIPRYGSCAALGTDGRLWISHGFTEEQTRFADTRAYDFSAGAWTDETPSAGDVPVARCLHACLTAADGRFVLYAGQTTGVPALGDLWALTDGQQAAGSGRWKALKAALPPARNLYAFASWPTASSAAAFVVFGGGSLDRGYLDDTWVFSAADLDAKVLTATGGPPPARSATAFVADAPAGRLVLFGGRNADHAFADVWSLELR